MVKVNLIKYCGLLFAVSVCAVVYWPSLSGPFLFDDFPNLNPLLNYNLGLTPATEFIFGGSSSFLGRPVSMLSFLIGSESYPHSPWVFKFINLTIHLFNGIVVFFFTHRLCGFTTLHQERTNWFALFCTLIWLLHPFLLSSVLLVIQRMTLLMTFFSIAALLAYLKARENWFTRKGLVYLGLYSVFGLLSILSKENGVLIPLYVLVLETTLLNKLKLENRHLDKKLWLFVKGPVLVILGYIIFKLPEFISGYSRREFSFVERLLTEPRIILDYIHNIFVPSLGNAGIFHDDYLVSKSLIDPVSTLLSIAVIGILLISAIYFRKQFSVYSMAILFFFAGHLIESTVVPLELYFEHRNYLPSIGLIFGLSYFIFSKITNVKKLAAFVIIYLFLIGGISYLNAKVWGDLSSISRVWAVENPSSVRAQMLLARYYGDVQRYDLAKSALKKAEKIKPSDIPLQFQLIVNECLLSKNIDQLSLMKSVKTIRNGRYSHGISGSLLVLVKMLGDNLCDGITANNLIMLFEAALSNSNMKNTASRQSLFYQLGEVQLFKGLYEEAMISYDNLHRIKPNADIYVMQIKVSLSLGKFEQANFYLLQLKTLEENASMYKKSYQEIIEQFSLVLSGGSISE